MREKRFRVMNNDSKQLYCIESVDGEMFSMQEIVDCLNEQQATIDSLQTELELISGEKLFSRRELERKVKEQEATINKQEKRLKFYENMIIDCLDKLAKEGILLVEQ